MMSKSRPETVEIDTQPFFTIHEICAHGEVDVEFVVELVEYGVILPLAAAEPQQWVFDAAALARLKRALRLQRDLDINLPGLAVSLDLLDEIKHLHRQINLLDRQLKQLLGE